DLCPGTCSGGAQPLGFFHGSLYFAGNDSERGPEIWRTDGTAGGEELLADVCPGACRGLVNGWVEWRGALWFMAQAEDAALALWTSDGTREGTRQVGFLCTDLAICAGPNQYVFLGGPDPSGQGLLVWTYGPLGRQYLFRTDATKEGTFLLHRFEEGFQFIDQIPRAAPGVPLYFVDGAELWTSDGTRAGTRLVRSLVGLVQSFPPLSMEVVGGIYYATFYDDTWLRSDGTAAGTFVLAQLGTGTDPGSTVAHIGSTVFVLTSHAIWRTGGTPETTSSFEGPAGPPLFVVERADRLFVLSDDPAQGRPFLWTTDGTPAGTRKLRLGRGPGPDQFGLAAFRDGAVISRGTHELWKIDRTGSHLERLHDFQPANGGSGPREQVALGNRLIFFSLIDGRRSRLFSSDGTSDGTSQISSAGGIDVDFEPRPAFALTRAGDKAFFSARKLLWATDGTREGTRAFSPRSSFYKRFGLNAPIGVFGDRFVFSATLDVSQVPFCGPGDGEPWVSDGVHGTKRLLNLNPYFFEPAGDCTVYDLSSSPGPGVALGGIALFAADD